MNHKTLRFQPQRFMGVRLLSLRVEAMLAEIKSAVDCPDGASNAHLRSRIQQHSYVLTSLTWGWSCCRL